MPQAPFTPLPPSPCTTRKTNRYTHPSWVGKYLCVWRAMAGVREEWSKGGADRGREAVGL